jgi:hypothetical protein
MMCAMNQLVNHLDAIPVYSSYRPKVIIRVAVGSRAPLDPGPQHVFDGVSELREMLDEMWVDDYGCGYEESYKAAYERDKSTIIVER